MGELTQAQKEYFKQNPSYSMSSSFDDRTEDKYRAHTNQQVMMRVLKIVTDNGGIIYFQKDGDVQ